ncbi:MAG: hypothetical protein, partial [Olavius algarvensis Delta 4 endosymbiont]
ESGHKSDRKSEGPVVGWNAIPAAPVLEAGTAGAGVSEALRL